MKIDTKKNLLQYANDKFGRYSVNEFLKKCLRLAIDKPDFFFDTLTNVVNTFYFESHNFEDLEKKRFIVRGK